MCVCACLCILVFVLLFGFVSAYVCVCVHSFVICVFAYVYMVMQRWGESTKRERGRGMEESIARKIREYTCNFPIQRYEISLSNLAHIIFGLF